MAPGARDFDSRKYLSRQLMTLADFHLYTETQLAIIYSNFYNWNRLEFLCENVGNALCLFSFCSRRALRMKVRFHGPCRGTSPDQHDVHCGSNFILFSRYSHYGTGKLFIG